jgi:hypothetical protein
MPDTAAVQSLAFLIGDWSGSGHGDYPTISRFRFEHRLTISHDGRPFLQSISRTWLLDEHGERVRPTATELGFWRPQPDGGAELLVVLPTGIAEVYVGTVSGVRAEIHTHAVARTPTAKEVAAGRRVYALEGEELVYTHDMAAVGEPLQPHISSRLRRTAGSGSA